MRSDLGIEKESEQQKVPLTIRLPRRTYKRIKEISNANNISLAEVGRRLIHRCLENEGFQQKEVENDDK